MPRDQWRREANRLKYKPDAYQRQQEQEEAEANKFLRQVAALQKNARKRKQPKRRKRKPRPSGPTPPPPEQSIPPSWEVLAYGRAREIEAELCEQTSWFD